MLITWNLSDFPADALAKRGLRVLGPDAYLCELYDELPDAVRDTVIRLASEKRDPPVSAHEAAARLAKAGVSRFADLVLGALGPVG